uniref:AlNc14C22G2263 protein n=1 Tax=Albugo laibachii Nc14 TaxID=890382 RepID=F0W5U8_9STRA|nr:AlNc14C22G2263 [Albugo laibachii Nc14]|eukprot:CCA16489.1 AlNc14C22G2263 [Albugo laibachii Nc14]
MNDLCRVFALIHSNKVDAIFPHFRSMRNDNELCVSVLALLVQELCYFMNIVCVQRCVHLCKNRQLREFSLEVMYRHKYRLDKDTSFEMPESAVGRQRHQSFRCQVRNMRYRDCA